MTKKIALGLVSALLALGALSAPAETTGAAPSPAPQRDSGWGCGGAC